MNRDEVQNIFLPAWVGFYPENTLTRERAEKHAPRINAKRKEKAGLFADDETFTRATVTADSLLAGRNHMLDKQRETDMMFFDRSATYATERSSVASHSRWDEIVSRWIAGSLPKEPHFLADYLHRQLRELTGYVAPSPSFSAMSKEKQAGSVAV